MLDFFIKSDRISNKGTKVTEWRIMTSQDVIDFCLLKRGAYLDYPFGPEVTIVKVGKTEERSGRIFAQVFFLKGKDMVTLNCDRETGQFYRQIFPDTVVRGYHCPPIQQPYFNTFSLNGSVPDDIIMDMIEHSYQTVVRKLPKYVRNKIET